MYHLTEKIPFVTSSCSDYKILIACLFISFMVNNLLEDLFFPKLCARYRKFERGRHLSRTSEAGMASI